MSQRRDQEVALSRTLPAGLATIWLYQWICCTARVTMNVWGTTVGVGHGHLQRAGAGLMRVPDLHHLPVHRTAQLIKSLTRGAAPAGLRASPDRPGRAGGRGGEHADPGADHRRLGLLRRQDPQPALARAEVPQAVPAGGPSVFVNPAQATTAPASRRRPRPRGVTSPRTCSLQRRRSTSKKCLASGLRIRAACHSEWHSQQVRYSVLNSKNRHNLEPPYGIEP
jgi:hypothetical protein